VQILRCYVVFYRNNGSSEWIDSHVSESNGEWTVVTHLQPYTQYQFQLVLHNATVLESDWITTDMDGTNVLIPSAYLSVVCSANYTSSIHYIQLLHLTFSV